MDNNKKKEELQSRRDFFKKASKAVLPIVGAIALSAIPSIVKAEAHTGCFGGGCYGDCSGACQGGCMGCTGTCTGGCEGACGGNCYYGCTGTCSKACASSSYY